jgi:hypothetical protein
MAPLFCREQRDGEMEPLFCRKQRDGSIILKETDRWQHYSTGNREMAPLTTNLGAGLQVFTEVWTYSYVAFLLNTIPLFPFNISVSEASLMNISTPIFV